MNPNGRIPAIDDNGFKLWESMAINLYLPEKHGSGLLPKTMEDEAQAIQWSFWAMTEVEKPALAVLLHRFFLPEDQRDSRLADEGEQQLQKPLEVLDQRLATTGYLVGPLSRSRTSTLHRCCLGPDGRGRLVGLPAGGSMACRMPEAAGRGEGETADGKVTWLVDRCRLRINTRKMTWPGWRLESTATLKPNVGEGGHGVGSDRHYRDHHGAVMPRRAPHGELAAGLGPCDELSLPPEFQPLFRSTTSTQPFGSPC